MEEGREGGREGRRERTATHLLNTHSHIQGVCEKGLARNIGVSNFCAQVRFEGGREGEREGGMGQSSHSVDASSSF